MRELTGHQLAGITAATFTFLSLFRHLRLDEGNSKATEYKWFNALAEELDIPAEDLRTMVNARVKEPYSFLWLNTGVVNTWNTAALDSKQIQNMAYEEIPASEAIT